MIISLKEVPKVNLLLDYDEHEILLDGITDYIRYLDKCGECCGKLNMIRDQMQIFHQDLEPWLKNKA